MTTPEAKARANINAQLAVSGWGKAHPVAGIPHVTLPGALAERRQKRK